MGKVGDRFGGMGRFESGLRCKADDTWGKLLRTFAMQLFGAMLLGHFPFENG